MYCLRELKETIESFEKVFMLFDSILESKGLYKNKTIFKNYD